jgi:hypothetical protein
VFVRPLPTAVTEQELTLPGSAWSLANTHCCRMSDGVYMELVRQATAQSRAVGLCGLASRLILV